MRPGELLGLTGEGVDLDQGVLRISRAVSRVGGTVQLGPTKTAASRRQLRLPAGTEDALRQHRDRQLAQQNLTGAHWHDLGLVFLSPQRTESDNMILMRTVTATEASRSFAALLDEVERGETVVVTRGGKRIASIGPASVGNGADVLALLAHDVDEDFAADVAAARDAVTPEGPAWPAD